jgi:hypothetical protein
MFVRSVQQGLSRAAPQRGDPSLIGVSITAAAFEAIATTMPLGSVSFEPQLGTKGDRQIWLDDAVVNRLKALRGPGESYSDVILRVAAEAQ